MFERRLVGNGVDIVIPTVIDLYSKTFGIHTSFLLSIGRFNSIHCDWYFPLVVLLLDNPMYRILPLRLIIVFFNTTWETYSKGVSNDFCIIRSKSSSRICGISYFYNSTSFKFDSALCWITGIFGMLMKIKDAPTVWTVPIFPKRSPYFPL